VKHLKDASTHLLTQKLYSDTFFEWQGAYGAFSVSLDDLGRVSVNTTRTTRLSRIGNSRRLLATKAPDEEKPAYAGFVADQRKAVQARF
jgi:hypothetical protein